MTTSMTTSAVYIQVIEDVIDKVKQEFNSAEGPGANVLQELQTLWELKMMQAGAVLPASERPAVQKQVPGGPAVTPPVHDLNVPYEGTEEYETPTAEMLFPPTPAQTPAQTPFPDSATTPNSSMFNIPTGPSDYPTPSSNEGSGASNTDIKPAIGRPSPYMQPPPSLLNQRPPFGVDVNVAYEENREEADRGTSQGATQDFFTGPSGKRKRDEIPPQYQTGGYIPQQDGAGDSTPIFELEIIQSKTSERQGRVKFTSEKATSSLQKGSSSRIPQLDGPIPDPYEDMLSTPNIYNYQGVVNEDYNVNTPAPDLQAGTPALPVQNDVADEDDDDEPPLNENDDDELDDVDQGEELNTQHLVLAQFDKVTRTKSRWKCTLKDGIMHINKKDILFNKASGEFDF